MLHYDKNKKLNIYIYIYITLPILLLATLILGAIVLSGNNTANAQTKTGVQEVDRYWRYKNVDASNMTLVRHGRDNSVRIAAINGSARDVVRVKNYSKSGGNCHTKYKIESISFQNTIPIILYKSSSLPAGSGIYVTNTLRLTGLNEAYDGHYIEINPRAYKTQNSPSSKVICVPFGKTRRVATEWQTVFSLQLNFDLVFHYHLTQDDINNGVKPTEVKHLNYNYHTVSNDDVRDGYYMICAWKFPTISYDMAEIPQRTCIDIDTTPVVYRCYVGMTQGDVSSVAPHSSNITIKAGSIKHEHSDKYKYGHARKQTAEIAIDNGGCNTYADGTSDYPAYASGIWKIYSYEYK